MRRASSSKTVAEGKRHYDMRAQDQHQRHEGRDSTQHTRRGDFVLFTNLAKEKNSDHERRENPKREHRP